jgi:hypothetical protein
MPSPKADLRVQVIDDEIIVTRPGSSYAVTYYSPRTLRSYSQSVSLTTMICAVR